MRNKQSGLTLIELLVACTLFVWIGSAAALILQQVHQSKVNQEKRLANLQYLQRGMSRIRQDLEQIILRIKRDEHGSYTSPLTANDKGIVLDFIREGAARIPGTSRSSLERVRYLYEDEKVYRESTQALDITTKSVWKKVLVFEGVEQFSFRFFMDNNWQSSWHEEEGTIKALPQAVMLLVLLKNTPLAEQILLLPENQE